MRRGGGRTEEGIVEVQKTRREDGGRRPFAAHQSDFKAKIHYIKERATLPSFGRRSALLAETSGLRTRSTRHSTRERVGGTRTRQ